MTNENRKNLILLLTRVIIVEFLKFTLKLYLGIFLYNLNVIYITSFIISLYIFFSFAIVIINILLVIILCFLPCNMSSSFNLPQSIKYPRQSIKLLF